MIEAARTSETSVDSQFRTRQYIPEDSELWKHTRQPKTSLDSASYKVFLLGNNTEGLESMCAFFCCRFHPSHTLSAYFQRTWNAQFRPDHCNVVSPVIACTCWSHSRCRPGTVGTFRGLHSSARWPACWFARTT
jgi:hypothetical protein